MIDPDEHLLGTPWDYWRREVSEILGVTPSEVSLRPDTYDAFNSLISPTDYVKGLFA